MVSFCFLVSSNAWGTADDRSSRIRPSQSASGAVHNGFLALDAMFPIRYIRRVGNGSVSRFLFADTNGMSRKVIDCGQQWDIMGALAFT